MISCVVFTLLLLLFQAFVFPTLLNLSLSCLTPSRSASVLRIKSKNDNVTTTNFLFAQYTYLLLFIKYFYMAEWVPGTVLSVLYQLTPLNPKIIL